MVLLLAGLLFWKPAPDGNASAPAPALSGPVTLPAYAPQPVTASISRRAKPHTIIPNLSRDDVVTYTIDMGDSVFGIAQKYSLKPETILWANYELLNDDPDMISPGDKLFIPPVNGVYYKWKSGDTIDSVASRFDVQPIDILSWPGNDLDIANPQVQADTYVMVPGGHREFRQWLVPTIPRGRAGVNKSIYGPGACDTGEGGLGGTGSFVWPVPSHAISGNDYWSGHLGIDAAAGMGTPVYAADSGVVVYDGVIGGGYGNMILIDHGNGYQTLYAHLSSMAVRCGASVGRGQIIAYAGSTGNSTGPHLHFEVRYLGGFINPHYVLP